MGRGRRHSRYDFLLYNNYDMLYIGCPHCGNKIAESEADVAFVGTVTSAQVSEQPEYFPLQHCVPDKFAVPLLELSHLYIEVLESIGALGFVIFGLIGLFVGGFYLYNFGTDLLNVVPAAIQTAFHYPDVTNAGIIPYLNIFVGLKVFVGLSSIVIAFAGFKKIVEEGE